MKIFLPLNKINQYDEELFIDIRYLNDVELGFTLNHLRQIIYRLHTNKKIL